jgi:hypothetical protein
VIAKWSASVRDSYGFLGGLQYGRRHIDFLFRVTCNDTVCDTTGKLLVENGRIGV